MTDKNKTEYESIFEDLFGSNEKQSSKSSAPDRPALNERAVKALELIAYAQLFPIYGRLHRNWLPVAEEWLGTFLIEEPKPNSPGKAGN
jgi:hypothetical protein